MQNRVIGSISMFYIEFGGETPDMTAPQKVVIGHGHSPPGDESGEKEDLKKQVALKQLLKQ